MATRFPKCHCQACTCPHVAEMRARLKDALKRVEINELALQAQGSAIEQLQKRNERLERMALVLGRYIGVQRWNRALAGRDYYDEIERDLAERDRERGAP